MADKHKRGPRGKTPTTKETRQKRRETDQQTSSKAVFNFFSSVFGSAPSLCSVLGTAPV